MKESIVFIEGAKQGEWAAHAQKTPDSPMASREGFLKTTLGEGCRVHDFLLIG